QAGKSLLSRINLSLLLLPTYQNHEC
ncbi:uncharacterized protein METZ01_LOCUS485729, partial [marine metagenome]